MDSPQQLPRFFSGISSSSIDKKSKIWYAKKSLAIALNNKAIAQPASHPINVLE
jgi:hypothetical protein